MARKLRSIEEINDFVASVTDAAEHHAPKVKRAVSLLAEAVLAQLDFPRDSVVEVYERNGQIARTCWVSRGHQRWVFSYNYRDEAIDLRQRSTQGLTLCQFDDDTDRAKLFEQIERLMTRTEG